MSTDSSWKGFSLTRLIGGAASGCRDGKAARVHLGCAELGRVIREKTGPPRVFRSDGYGQEAVIGWQRYVGDV